MKGTATHPHMQKVLEFIHHIDVLNAVQAQMFRVVHPLLLRHMHPLPHNDCSGSWMHCTMEASTALQCTEVASSAELVRVAHNSVHLQMHAAP